MEEEIKGKRSRDKKVNTDGRLLMRRLKETR